MGARTVSIQVFSSRLRRLCRWLLLIVLQAEKRVIIVAGVAVSAAFAALHHHIAGISSARRRLLVAPTGALPPSESGLCSRGVTTCVDCSWKGEAREHAERGISISSWCRASS